MSEPTPKQSRRHANVVNLDEAVQAERTVGTKFGARFRPLTAETGAQSLACNWFEVPPGRAAMPRHFHCAQEEAVFVLDGRGTLRIGDDTIELRAGDWVSFPVGPAHAHLIVNSGDGPLRYLALSTANAVDVVGYPDSKKYMAAAKRPGCDWSTSPWVKLLFPEEAAVDYMYRETIE